MTDDEDLEVIRAEMAAAKIRRAVLAGEHGGMPKSITPSDALAAANATHVPVDQTATADDVYAFIYRNKAAADAWGESNLTYNKVPTLAQVPLPDGRVIGILDLRPALKRFREEL